jgi:hypothetical protein
MRHDPKARPDRLPRRGTDRLEDFAAWLLVSVGLLLVVLAVTVGLGLSGSAMARVRAEAADRVSVPATASQDVPIVVTAPGTTLPRLLAEVTWTDADGVPGTGPALVPAGTRAGQPVTIWLDRAGRPVAEPLDESAAVVAAIAGGAVVLLAGAVVLGFCWVGARSGIAVLNARGWDREWAQVEPQWTGRGRHDAGHDAGHAAD